MSIKLKDLRKTTRSTTFAYDGETVTIEYRPGAITPRVQYVANAMLALEKTSDLEDMEPVARDAALARQRTTTMEAVGDYMDVIVAIVATWDVLGDDGLPLPVTRDNLIDLPYAFINAIFGAVMRGDSDAPNANGKT